MGIAAALAVTGCTSTSQGASPTATPKHTPATSVAPSPASTPLAGDISFADGANLVGDPAWVIPTGGGWSNSAASDPAQGVFELTNTDGSKVTFAQKKVTAPSAPGDDDASTLAVFTAAGFTKSQLDTAGFELGPIATGKSDAPLVEFYFTTGKSASGAGQAVYARLFTKDSVVLTATFTSPTYALLETDATALVKRVSVSTD